MRVFHYPYLLFLTAVFLNLTDFIIEKLAKVFFSLVEFKVENCLYIPIYYPQVTQIPSVANLETCQVLDLLSKCLCKLLG